MTQCQAITKSKPPKQCTRNAVSESKFCWQHENTKNTSIKSQNTILQKIPKDVFSMVGSYLTYPEIKESTISKFPETLTIKKDCLTVKNFNLDFLKYLSKNYPGLKSLILIATQIRTLDI